MSFGRFGGFYVNFNGGAGNLLNGLSDGYRNPCLPQTVGIGNRIPVTVRVRVGVGVSVGQPATQDQRQNLTQTQRIIAEQTTGQNLQISVQQATVVVPQISSQINPIRAHQSQAAGQEIVVNQVPVGGNTALEAFSFDSGTTAGVTLLAPMRGNSLAQTNQAMRALSNEVAVQAATNLQVVDDAAIAASGKADEALLLAQKLKQLGQVKAQQLLQQAGLNTFDAGRIAGQTFGSVDDLAVTLRGQTLSNGARLIDTNIARNTTQAAQQIAVRSC